MTRRPMASGLRRAARGLLWALPALLAAVALPAAASDAGLPFQGPSIGRVPVEFLLFALVLAGVALFHNHTFHTAVGGAIVISLYRIVFSPLPTGAGVAGYLVHLQHEWVMLANLLGLLMGFALLARHFEESGIPDQLPRFLPDDWKGGFVLLMMVFVLSSFLDNIAAALIGGAVALTVYKGRVHVGYLAGIVAASNAGGAGSVVGDTTTTMMWISGIPPTEVLNAYVAAGVALLVSGFFAARQQHALQPIQRDPTAGARIDWGRVGIVALILVLAMGVNIVVNTRYAEIAGAFPFIGVAVWVAILVGASIRKTDWSVLPGARRGAIFLLCLVLCASLMPVSELPRASWQTAFGLGFVSAVFDNIPLTELALKQGGYDWGVLAYAVGYGGSMMWFGSSSGVALTGMCPQARSVVGWVREGWHVAVGYALGFGVLLAVLGFHPGSSPRGAVGGAVPVDAAAPQGTPSAVVAPAGKPSP